jgi:hypothetical protein
MQSERTITLLQRDFKENVELINSFIEHILGITKIKQKKRTRITLVFKMVGQLSIWETTCFHETI